VHIHAAIVPPAEILDEVAAALAGVPAESMERIPDDRLQLVVAGFGNVTAGDSRRIRTALGDLAAGLPRPQLLFMGPELVDTGYGTTVAARFEGDLDALSDIAKRVTRRVESLGFYVDRRRLNPWLEIARTKVGTSASEVAAVAEALRALVGRPWVVADIRILATLMDGDGSRFSEVERIPLGGGLSR
jgi:2'-5' RNA ligase